LQEERKERARAAARKNRKKNQNLARRIVPHTRSLPVCQFVQMPNGSLHRVAIAPNDIHDKAYPLKEHILCNLEGSGILEEEANMAPKPSQARKDLATSIPQSLENNVSQEELLVRTPKQKHKKSSTYLQKKQQLKSSVLIGSVEDASDSECEEDFNDYWHNRRPQLGNWIEPIEGAATYS